MGLLYNRTSPGFKKLTIEVAMALMPLEKAAAASP